jgi:hypothetical protein
MAESIRNQFHEPILLACNPFSMGNRANPPEENKIPLWVMGSHRRMFVISDEAKKTI